MSSELAAVAPEVTLGTDTPVTAPRKVRRWNRQVAADCVAFLDGFTVILGAAVPAIIYGSIGGVVTNWALLAQSSVAGALVTHLCLRHWNQYNTDRMHAFPVNPFRMMLGLVIGLLMVVGLGLPHAVTGEHIWIWFLTWLSASFVFMIFSRSMCSLVLKKLTARGRFDQRVAVFGAGAVARRVHDHLINPALGLKFKGVFDDRIGQERLNPEGIEVAGRLEELIDAARNDELDQIVIALPQAAADRIAIIAQKLSQLPVSVHIVTHISSDLIEAGGYMHTVSNLGPVGMIDLKPKPLEGWSPILKNLEDKVLGSALFIIATPLILLIAALIKLDSSGPVFFYQTRRGLNERLIRIIKFRTMNTIDDEDQIQQATKDDPRVTRVGKILRRFSLDELPQLVNVLRGEMSLVGPRPHAVAHDDDFNAKFAAYANRRQVKPGMTGLAQIRGHRGGTSDKSAVEARIDSDMEYIRTWRLSLDIKILLKTIIAVIAGKNAY
jgi:Undecaprenyl-phosphate glucose phosphotransferase